MRCRVCGEDFPSEHWFKIDDVCLRCYENAGPGDKVSLDEALPKSGGKPESASAGTREPSAEEARPEEKRRHIREPFKRRDYYQLNEGEKILDGSQVASALFDRGGFVLTNQRVIQIHRTPLGGESEVLSFFLENLDSIQNRSRKSVGCAFFAILFLATALGTFVFQRHEDWMLAAVGGLVVASILSWVVYLATRKRLIRLSSGRTEIALDVSPFSVNGVQELVAEIEQAKACRLDQVRSRVAPSEPLAAIPGAPNPKTTKERLEELRDIHRNGLITAEEYDAKRREILDSI